MISAIKTKIIALLSIIFTVITLGAYARYQTRKRHEAERINKQLKQLTNDAIQRQKAVHNAYKLDADAIDDRLQQYYRD